MLRRRRLRITREQLLALLQEDDVLQTTVQEVLEAEIEEHGGPLALRLRIPQIG